MTTEELIVTLARSAGAVRPLACPSARLARWTAVSAPLMLVAAAIGARADLAVAAAQPRFLALAAVTIVTSLLAALSVLVLAIPGAERSRLQRALPLMAAGAWITLLVALLAADGAPIRRLLQFPFHWACLIEIVGFGLVPAWLLFAMLNRAAPMRRAWSGALATLAALSISAAATQIICPIDDPAHHLVGHVLPVVVGSIVGTIIGRRYLSAMVIRPGIHAQRPV